MKQTSYLYVKPQNYESYKDSSTNTYAIRLYIQIFIWA